MVTVLLDRGTLDKKDLPTRDKVTRERKSSRDTFRKEIVQSEIVDGDENDGGVYRKTRAANNYETDQFRSPILQPMMFECEFY
jgi:hypothetical protein